MMTRRVVAYMTAVTLLCVARPATAQNAAPGNAASAQSSSGAEARTAKYFESIRNDPSQLAIFLRDMPKGADLHYHLSGGVYAETYINWAAQDSLCVDTRSFAIAGASPCDAAANRVSAASALQNATLYGQLIDAWSMRNWNAARRNGHDQFFDTFGKFGGASGSNHTADMLADVANRAGTNRVSYMEIMWTPDGGGASGLGRSTGWGNGDFAAMRERLLAAGLRDTIAKASRRIDSVFARQRTVMGCSGESAQGGRASTTRNNNASDNPGCNVQIRILYQVLRAFPKEQVFAQILTGFEMASSDPRVVGLNLVQPEDNYVAMRDFTLHMQMIQFLHTLYPNVKISLHAGELAPGLVPPDGLRFHIDQSVRIAGASRIGHGVDIAQENEAVALLKEMARRSVMVEINLTSNAVILGVSGKQHPLHLYMKYGVPVALSTDDEGVARSDMNLEYQRAVEEQGLGYVALKKMARTSITHSFANETTRRALLASLDASFKELESRYGH